MTSFRSSLVVLLAASALAMSPQDDRRKVSELERKVAELERRIQALEMQLNNVPIAKTGGTTVTKHHLNLARDLEAIRSGGAKTETALLLDLVECAAYREILHRFGVLLTAEEILAERTRNAQDPLAPKMHALLDPYPGAFDLLVVFPGLSAAKLRATFQTDKRANQIIFEQADALLKRALADPSAISAAGRDKTGEYRRMDTKSLNGAQRDWAKAFEDKYLDPLKDGQVLPNVIDTDEGYYVTRLIDSRKHSCIFEYVLFRKGSYETWLRDQLRAIEIDVLDPGMKQEMLARPAGHCIADRMAGR